MAPTDTPAAIAVVVAVAASAVVTATRGLEPLIQGMMSATEAKPLLMMVLPNIHMPELAMSPPTASTPVRYKDTWPAKITNAIKWPIKTVLGMIQSGLTGGATAPVTHLIDAPANIVNIGGTLDASKGDQALNDANAYIYNKTQVQPNVDQGGGVLGGGVGRELRNE